MSSLSAISPEVVTSSLLAAGAVRRRRPTGEDSRSCSAAARRVAALGDRRIFTAASLRDAAAGRDALPVEALGLRVVDVSARGVRGLRVLARVLAAADRVVGLLAVRMVRAVVLFAAVFRGVAAAVRAPPRVPAGLARLVAGFAVRTGAFRAVVDTRFGAARVEAARLVVVRLPAARFAGAAALARVVFFGAALAAVLVVLAAVRFTGVRVALARVAVALVAVRGVFAAALPGLGPGLVAVVDRVVFAAPRVVRVVVARALLPAVRRPPARMAMARVRLPSELFSLLMIKILWFDRERRRSNGMVRHLPQS